MRPIHNNNLKLTALFITGLWVSACASQGPRQPTLDSIDAALGQLSAAQAQAPQPASAESISAALLPEFSFELPGSSGIDTEPRFDIKVNRADVRQFFMGLVEGTPHNVVLHPDVAGRITLDLKNVTVEQVLDLVRDVYGYDYERSANGFMVFPNTLATRIFKVNYLDVKRKGSSNLRVSSGQVSERVPTTGTGIGGMGMPQPPGQQGALSGSSINTESESNFWVDLERALKSIVGSEEGRSVVVSPHSGIIVVRGMPAELRAVDQFVRSTQKISQRQVILEAKIIEVELNERFQSGINWSALRLGSNNYQASQTGGGSIFGGSGLSSIVGNTGDLNPGALDQVVGSATSAFGGVFSLALNIGNDFAAFIELLKTQGDVQVLSSPKVSTINNQKAVIKVGQDEFFITDVASTTDVVTGASSTQSNVQLTPFFTGVALDVIPQISQDGDIILHIHPSVSNVTEKIKNISVSTATTLSVPLAISTIRESDSIIRARSGQVVVIGGLMQDSVNDEVAKVPLLGDLPLIGGLFRHTREVKRKSELVILLKPTVVEGDATWEQEVHNSQQRIRQLRGGN